MGFTTNSSIRRFLLVETRFSKSASYALFIFLPIVGLCVGYETAGPLYIVEEYEHAPENQTIEADDRAAEKLFQNVPIRGEYLSTHLNGLPINEFRLAFSKINDGEVQTLFSSYHSEAIDVVCHTPTSAYRWGILYINSDDDPDYEFEQRITSCVDIIVNPSKTKLAVATENSVIIIELLNATYFKLKGPRNAEEAYGYLNGDLYFQPDIYWHNEDELIARVHKQSRVVGSNPLPVREELIFSSRSSHHR